MDSSLTNGLVCGGLQADLTPLMRRLGNKASLFLRFLLALLTDSHAKFSANSSGTRRQIVISISVCSALPTKFRAYDRAAIKFRGVEADINFNLEDYKDDMKQVIDNPTEQSM